MVLIYRTVANLHLLYFLIPLSFASSLYQRRTVPGFLPRISSPSDNTSLSSDNLTRNFTRPTLRYAHCYAATLHQSPVDPQYALIAIGRGSMGTGFYDDTIWSTADLIANANDARVTLVRIQRGQDSFSRYDIMATAIELLWECVINIVGGYGGQAPIGHKGIYQIALAQYPDPPRAAVAQQ